MLKTLPNPKKEDICPNCGTACFATDILCPNCGKNLDELFEQLPDLEESYSLSVAISKHLPFLTWLTPLLFVLSPLIASLVIAVPFALQVPTTPDRSPLGLIWYVLPSSALTPSIFLIICALPLFLCTTPLAKAKFGRRWLVILAGLFSILSVIALWSGLQTTNMMSIFNSLAYFGIEVFLGWANWVNFVTAGGALLVLLNLMVIIGQEKTA